MIINLIIQFSPLCFVVVAAVNSYIQFFPGGNRNGVEQECVYILFVFIGSVFRCDLSKFL